MKKIFIALVIIITHSLSNGMQSNAPAQESQPANPSVRARLFNTVLSAVHGAPITNPITDNEFGEDYRQASPASFCQLMKLNMEQYLFSLFAKKGITRDQIIQLIPEVNKEALALLQAQQFVPASSPIKKAVAEITQVMPGPEMQVVEDNTIDTACVCLHVVKFNAQHLADQHITPKKLRAIAGHERRHYLNHDSLIRGAFNEALQRRAAAASQALSPSSKELYHLLLRHQETFADLETSSINPELAQESERISEHFVQLYGDGQPGIHPSHIDRLKLAKLMAALHQEQQNETNERRSRVKRRLVGEFNKAAQEEPRISAKTLVDKDGHVKIRFKRSRLANQIAAASSSASSLQK